MAFVAGSDARVVSPVFTDLDESPSVAEETPTLAVSSARTGGVIAAPTVTVGATTGTYQATLTAAVHLTAPDILTLTWTADVGGAARTLTQTVDVAGGVYVSTDELARLRTVPDSGSTLDAVRFWRDAFERLAEQARGVAYVPRFASEVVPCGSSVKSLPHKQVTSIVSEVADGTDTTVSYVHGYDLPPPAIQAACKEFVRAKLLTDTSDQQRNVLAFTNLATGEQYRYGTADWSAGRFTGLTQVDDLINSVRDERVMLL